MRCRSTSYSSRFELCAAGGNRLHCRRVRALPCRQSIASIRCLPAAPPLQVLGQDLPSRPAAAATAAVPLAAVVGVPLVTPAVQWVVRSLLALSTQRHPADSGGDGVSVSSGWSAMVFCQRKVRCAHIPAIPARYSTQRLCSIRSLAHLTLLLLLPPHPPTPAAGGLCGAAPAADGAAGRTWRRHPPRRVHGQHGRRTQRQQPGHGRQGACLVCVCVCMRVCVCVCVCSMCSLCVCVMT